MCYTKQQIEHIVRYYAFEIKRRLYALQKLCSGTNIELPQPPKYLCCHTVRIAKNSLKMEFCLKRELPHLSAGFSVLKCYQHDGNLFSSIGGLFIDDRNGDNSISSCQVETVTKALILRPASLDSFIWYCDHAIRWLDSTYESIQRHLDHLRHQRQHSKNHQLVMEKLAEVESALIAQKLAGI